MGRGNLQLFIIFSICLIPPFSLVSSSCVACCLWCFVLWLNVTIQVESQCVSYQQRWNPAGSTGTHGCSESHGRHLVTRAPVGEGTKMSQHMHTPTSIICTSSLLFLLEHSVVTLLNLDAVKTQNTQKTFK